MDGCSNAGNVRNVVTRHLDSRLRGPLARCRGSWQGVVSFYLWSWRSEPSAQPSPYRGMLTNHNSCGCLLPLACVWCLSVGVSVTNLCECPLAPLPQCSTCPLNTHTAHYGASTLTYNYEYTIISESPFHWLETANVFKHLFLIVP